MKLDADMLIFGYGPIIEKIIKKATTVNLRVVCVTDNFSRDLGSKSNPKAKFLTRNKLEELTISSSNVFFAWRNVDPLLNNSNNLSEWVKRNLIVKNKSFLLSSASVYKDSTDPVTEDERNLDIQVSKNEKYKLEIYLKNLMVNKGVLQVNLRASNIYGNGIKYGFIGNLIQALETGKPVEVYNKVPFVRDYIHFEDFYTAINTLCEKEFGNSEINISTGKGYSVNRIIELLMENCYPINLINPVLADPGLKKYSILDTSLLKEIIDWDPRYLEEAIPELVTVK